MTRVFILSANVSREFLRESPVHARSLARDVLFDKMDDLTGPRGGRYKAVGTPFNFRDRPSEDFTRPDHVFTARVRGRYVRPSR